MQRTRVCSETSCTCPSTTVGRCKYYGPHSFENGLPFPHGSFPSTITDPHGCDPYNNGGTYPPNHYMAPEVIRKIIIERIAYSNRKTTSSTYISTVA